MDIRVRIKDASDPYAAATTETIKDVTEATAEEKLAAFIATQRGTTYVAIATLVDDNGKDVRLVWK